MEACRCYKMPNVLKPPKRRATRSSGAPLQRVCLWQVSAITPGHHGISRRLCCFRTQRRTQGYIRSQETMRGMCEQGVAAVLLLLQ